MIKKILFGILLVVVISVVAFGAIFDNAARQAAKHDLQGYYESHEDLAELAYYANWRHGFNNYLKWLPGDEKSYPFLWIANKHKRVYESLSEKVSDDDVQIYADYLFYIKPCLTCIYPAGDVHLQKGLELATSLAEYTGHSSLLARNGLEVAADTFGMIFQMNAERITTTRAEYHHLLVGLWRFFKISAVSENTALPYLARKKAFFFLGLFKQVSRQVKELGAVKLGCEHPLVLTFVEMEKQYDDMIQLATSEIKRYSRGEMNINIKNEARESINADIRNICTGIDAS